jgi:outer membrane beta-barrel protein
VAQACEPPPAPSPATPTPPPDAASGPDAAPEAPPAAEPAAEPAPAPPPSSTAQALGRQSARIKCLDESLVDEFGRARARKGVQPRDFRKALRVALSVTGRAWAGDLASTSWQGGGALAFWISEDLGIEAQYRITSVEFRLERAASGFTGQDRYPNRVRDNLGHVAHARALWSVFHTKLRAAEDRIIHGDFVLFAGAGKTFHDTVQGVGFEVGASMYLFPAKWLSIRLDLADHILNQEILGSTRISNNLLFSAGIGIWMPPRIRS